jgi:Lysyl oxidase
LPNLRALPASDLIIVVNASGTPELHFSATSWNSGNGPFELRARDPRLNVQTNEYEYDAWQRIYDTSGGYREVKIGTFIFHPAHNHIHLEGYAVYRLRPAGDNGASPRESFKTSFCIEDTNKIDPRLPGAPRKAVYTTCNPDVQGMSVGYGDRYGYNLAGQSIDLSLLQDGLYELSIAFDPANKILETSDSDNTSCLLLQIGVASRTVQMLGACGTNSGAVTISSITPNSAWAGTITNDVTVSGSNFSPGIAVGFENGSGPIPVVSNVNVLNSSTIVMTVTIKNGGGGSGSGAWDLRVGSAVLPGSFTVLR